VATSDTVGGAVIRRLAPWVIVFTFVITWISAAGERIGLYDPVRGVLVMTAVYFVFVIPLLIWNVELLQRVDNERLVAEEAQFRERQRNLQERAARSAAEASEQRYQSLAEAFQRLSHELIRMQERERSHLARELHDEMGQNLTALKINLEMLRDPNSAESSRFDDSFIIISRILAQVQDLSRGLRPPLLEEAGLTAALRAYLKEQSERFGLQIDFRSTLEADPPRPEVDLALYRIVQEAITNVVRHSKARYVFVALFRNTESAQIELTIHDNGVGFESDSSGKPQRLTGLGIIGMEERAALLGGSFSIRSAAGSGTAISVRMPIPTSSS
jgi:signal transduction histidine kinase